MSKPLIFVLQFAGAIMMLLGFGGGQAGVGIAGLALVVIGGLAFRSRVKQPKTESLSDSELVNVLKEQNELLKKKLNEK